MDNKSIMSVEDVSSAKMASCLLTIKGRRYNFAQMSEFEAKFKKTKKKMHFLGKPGAEHVTTGWEGTWKGKMHYNQSIMRELFLNFKDTGIDEPFEIQITNKGNPKVGDQTIIYTGCTADDGVLSKFNVEDESLMEEVSGTFSDCKMPKMFNIPDFM